MLERKYFRVLTALVLALSLSLVMAVPVAADVSGITVQNVPATQGRAAEYTIGFTTTAQLFLAIPSTITITFPDDTTVSGTAGDYSGNVTVNDTVCASGVTATDRVVTINVPADIAAGPVEVVFDAAAGIKNPTDVDTIWQVQVKTSAETTGIDSETYSTTAVEAPTIVSVVGTAYQNSNDTIVITFSEAVVPTDADWMDVTTPGEEFTSIECDGSALTLADHDFAIDTTKTVLTITLDEAVDYLETGTDNLEVIPASLAIANDVYGDAWVSDTMVPGSVTGDTLAPTVALTYSDPDKLVKEGVSLDIVATFSEDMAEAPTITIVDAGSVTLVDAEVMTIGGSAKVWEYNGYNVPAGSDGTATVTISGTDLAGNANEVATHNTFDIDNTAPYIAVTAIVGTTIEGEDDKIVITFSDPVTATAWDSAFTSVVGTVSTGLTLSGASYSPTSGSTETLTITLSEADDDYLVNGETITVTPNTNAIKDVALNAMATDAVEGDTPVSGDDTPPTITRIVGVQGTPDSIKIAFSEVVLAADADFTDGTEVASVESPDGAPLNINNADFVIDATETVLTITLDLTYDAAVLDEGEVICVTLVADAIVDLAGNHLVAVEGNSGTDSGWLEVWVDVSWGGQAAVDPGLIWDANAFDTIQEGIDAVAEGGTVNVLTGAYQSQGQVDIDKSVTLIAETGDYRTSGVTMSDFYIAEATAKDDITIQGFNFLVTPAAGAETACGVGAFYTVDQGNGDNLKILSNSFTAAPSDDLGPAIGIYGTFTAEGLVIDDNLFTAVRGMHLLFGPPTFTSEVTITNNVIAGDNTTPTDVPFGGIAVSRVRGIISGNTITNTWDAGINVANSTDLTISNNIVTNAGGADWGDAGAINLYSDCTDITITGNTLSLSYDGITIKDVGALGSGIAVNYNNIVGNENSSVVNSAATGTLDATNNWWGSAIEAAIADNITGSVTYSPWLDAPNPYGEPTTTDGQTIEYPIQLVAGYNLISLPLVIDVEDSSIETVLAEVRPGITVNVAYYTGGPDGVWLTYIAGEPGVSDLTEMSDGKGYWIDASANGVLITHGVPFAQPGASPPAYLLVAGWNLIGFTSLSEDAVTPTQYLDELSSSMQAVYGYYAATDVYYIPSVDNEEPLPTHLVPGCGYWVAVSEPGLIFP